MHAAVQHVEAMSGQMVDYLKDLVRMPSVTPHGDHEQDHCLYALERLRQIDCAVVQVALTLSS